MADTENSFLLLALFAVLIPTINMIIEGKRIRLRPIRPVSSKIVAKINYSCGVYKDPNLYRPCPSPEPDMPPSFIAILETSRSLL